MRRGSLERGGTLAVASRVLATVGAGYACTAALVALAVQLLWRAAGLARSEAVVLAAMAGFVLYLVILVWGFAERRVWRIWALLLGGAALAWGLAIWSAAPAAAGTIVV